MRPGSVRPIQNPGGITGIDPGQLTAELCNLRGDFREFKTILRQVLEEQRKADDKFDALLVQNERIEAAVRESGSAVERAVDPIDNAIDRMTGAIDAMGAFPERLDRVIEALDRFTAAVRDARDDG